jgi:Leucine-rich repeat (LRR) protein
VLEQVIRDEISKQTGEITTDDLSQISDLFDDSGNIEDLTGVEECANLTYLAIQYSQDITDISMLAQMTQLRQLDLYGCTGITNIAALSSLVELTDLNIGHGGAYPVGFDSLSPISGLSELKHLELMDRDIDDTELQHLSGLVSLTWLSLARNDITDISLLSGMPNLTSIEPLVTNAQAGGVGSGDVINLRGTDLDTEAEEDVDTLRSTYGVTVHYP